MGLTSTRSSSNRWEHGEKSQDQTISSGLSTSLDLLRPGHSAAFRTLTAAWPQQTAEEQGIDSGNYNIKQSFEFGYRFTDFTGNQSTYDTFVNLQQGPRLLDMTLEMRSLNHQGLIFDRLYLSNFGYGGDPNNVSRLRIGKNKWYDFDAMFRRDENVWDYSLLANPLNPVEHICQCAGGL